MPSTRSSRRAGAISRRQRTKPRASTRELDPQERKLPPAPLPPEAAARSAADREQAETQRAQVRKVRQQIQQRKRAARRAGDEEELARLDAFTRSLEASVQTGSSPLDRF